MKNLYRAKADTVPLTMTQAVVSGQLIQIGNFVGCVANDASIGASVEVLLEGEVILPKNAADVIAQGAACHFDPATGIVISTGSAVAGVATQPAAAGSTTVYCRLTQAAEAIALGETSAGPRHEKQPEHAHAGKH